VEHDDNLDEVQRHALHRLKGYDELIQGHEAAQLMGEHGIHLHDEDPWEAGDVDDDHMVPKAHAVPHHHSAGTPLHTSQDTLYRSGLEHYIRHPYTGGGGIGPQPGEPHTWEHNGEHWIGGGHHRILADRMTYQNGTKVQDVTNRRRLGFKQAARAQLDFDHEAVENGGSTWPETHTIKGMHPDSGEQVGFLKYRTPRRAKDKIQIDRLEVHPEHQGNGFGSQMMDHLQERHPKTPIDHGDRTDDGQAWWNSYTRGKSVQRGRTIASMAPLYHGTSRDLTSVEPADRHGQGEVSTGLTRTDRAYATHDPQMARSYAEMSAVDTGGRPRVYEVRHNGPEHALEEDTNEPRYDADMMSPHGFRVLREVPEHELTRMPRRGAQERFRCPCGIPVEYDAQDGWQHADGSISHDGDLRGKSVSDLVDARVMEKRQEARRLGRYTAPSERLFGRTFGLDTRLFDEDHRLRDSVRMDVITRFNDFCHERGYDGWHRWAKIVFFGSEASEWTSKNRVGNGDFDLSIGIHYPALKATVPGFDGLADEIIAAGFTQEMHEALNDPHHVFPGVPGEFDQTWYANLQGWDIARIRPYAAYDVVDDEWIVKPPHLEDWSLKDFPEGPGMEEAVRGIIELAEGYLAMPEPHRTQNGAALWEFVHSNRSDAFGENGEGWWDVRNVIEKALDQKGLMQKLWQCHDRAEKSPESLASPSDWSNSPVAAR
jgi:GNAT superfamily N-acetyltransferase